MDGEVAFGLDTFGDVTVDGAGRPLADAFGVGEHHRPDVAVSGGRAEVTLGRGSFTESFPLFGYSLDQYEELFEDKLDRFAQLRTWVGVGGSPQSVLRAARYGLPLMVAIIGGDPRRFAPLIDRYRRAVAELGHPPLPVGVHSPGHVADTDEQALAELASRDELEQAAGPDGAMYVGAPETVAAKIAATVTALGLDRFDLKYSAGTLPHPLLMGSIERYGAEVVPRVRALVTTPG